MNTVAAMCSAGVALFAIGGWAAKDEVAAARGLEKIITLRRVCFAVPLAVFGALHLFGPQFVAPLVPRYMPWPMFWVYFVGAALIGASLSIATNVAIRWSGVLFGVMMFAFVAMIHLPGALARPDRIIWTIVFRETAFGGAAWLLAGTAAARWRAPGSRALINVGRACVLAAVLLFGVEHLLYPLGLPGVPLRKEMPLWIPGRPFIDYATGIALLITGGSVLLNRKVRLVAGAVGGWLLLLILLIYGPVLIGALASPETGVRMEGVNYFADTLLFTAALLALGAADQRL